MNKGKCFEATFKVIDNLNSKDDILSNFYAVMGICPDDLNFESDIILSHGHFKNTKNEYEPHAWIEINNKFAYETQIKDEDAPIMYLTEYLDNYKFKNIKRFNRMEVFILSHSDISDQTPWNEVDPQRISSILEKGVQQK